MSFPPSPGWVVKPESYNGLDIMGLRAPPMRVGNYCLNGVVTVTPAIRYLGFYCWVLKNYWSQERPADSDSFLDYALRCEYALVVGNRLFEPGTIHLVGSSKASIDQGSSTFTYEPLSRTPAASIYSNVAVQLHLTATGKSPVPRLTDIRGIVLAREVANTLERSKLGRILAAEGPPETYEYEELIEFGSLAHLHTIPDEELTLLESCILPEEPIDEAERRRISSYGLFLDVAINEGKRPTEKEFFDSVFFSEHIAEPLAEVRQGWSFFKTIEGLAALHENVLGHIVGNLRVSQHAVDKKRLLERLVNAPEQGDLLRDFGLLNEGEDLLSLSLSDLNERISEVTGDAHVNGGRLIWSNPICMERVVEAGIHRKDGSIAAALIGWLLALRMYRPTLDGDNSVWMNIARSGLGRLGLREVIAPSVQHWLEDGTPAVVAMAYLAQRTVEQHLRIVWSRRNNDGLHRDAARLVVDGDRWQYRAFFGGGRMDSRLRQAFGWMRALGLWNRDGVTPKGQEAHARILKTLEAS